MRGKIYFTHGNGFPSACYQQLIRTLSTRYECSFINKLGHDPRFPVTENWEFLVDELLFHIKLQFSEPIISVGHSFGGVLNCLAALKEPSLFSAVIMLDSPLVGRFKSHMIWWAKILGLIDRLTPAARAKKRKNFWHTKEELARYLRSKPLFKTFSNACLQDYINFGVKKLANGYQLHFDRDIEYLIYRTLPHNLADYEKRLHVPTALIYGDKSNVVRQSDVRYMEKKYAITCYRLHGTHMLPMETPELLAEQIFQALAKFNL